MQSLDPAFTAVKGPRESADNICGAISADSLNNIVLIVGGPINVAQAGERSPEYELGANFPKVTQKISRRRKVAIDHVTPGMYVVELDRPWVEVPFEAPFEIQGFTIRTPADLKKVSEFCDFVYIDPSLGIGAKRYIDSAAAKKKDGTYEKLFGVSPDELEPVYEDQLTLEEELVLSQQIVNDSQAVYEKVIQDLKEGKTIDTKAVKKIVSSLVNSIIRNPDAASLLIRLKRKDSYSYTHAMCVCVTGLAMGRYVGLPEADLNTLGSALLLQDIGKIQLPQSLLMKTEELSISERKMLNIHVDASVAMLRAKSGFDPQVIEIVRSHHERYDGSGYPKGIRGREVPLAASVAGLVDTYVAITFERPYRGLKTPFEALMLLYNERNVKFPAVVVENFIRCIGIFPVGSFVKLDTGEVGVVTCRNNSAQLRPRVMLILDANGKRLSRSQTVDLARPSSSDSDHVWRIAKVVDPAVYNLDPDEFFI